MIYESVIRNNQFNDLIKSPLEIMEECYKNEIEFLNYVIEYQNESRYVTESTDLDIIYEASVNNIIDKIKQIFNKFVDFCKRIFKLVRDKLADKFKNAKEQINKIKKNINDIDKDSSLNKDEKEAKKSEAIKPILRLAAPKSQETEQKNNKSKYRYIELSYISSASFVQVDKNITRILDILDDISYRDKEVIKKSLDMADNYINNTTIPSGIETYKSHVRFIEKELDTNKVIEIYENNLKTVEDAKNNIDNVEKINDRRISDLKKVINKMNKTSPDKGMESLTYYANLINKTISFLQKYLQEYINYLNAISNDIKPIKIS